MILVPRRIIFRQTEEYGLYDWNILYESDAQAFEYLNKLREFDSLVKQKEGTLDISNDNTFDRQNQAISDSVKEFFSAMH